jgi:hypothetical protein
VPNIDPLLERNKHFAATTAREGVSIAAKHQIYACIGYLSQAVIPASPRFEVAVIHHHRCGTSFLADADSAAASPTSSAVTTAAPMHTSTSDSTQAGGTHPEVGTGQGGTRRGGAHPEVADAIARRASVNPRVDAWSRLSACCAV